MSRAVQCALWGYPTEGAYYRDASSTDALLAIRIPFLAINAEDDPVSRFLFFVDICIVYGRWLIGMADFRQASDSIQRIQTDTIRSFVDDLLGRPSWLVWAGRLSMVYQTGMCMVSSIKAREMVLTCSYAGSQLFGSDGKKNRPFSHTQTPEG